MRHGRAKAARRTLRFFQLHAGIRPPYKVLLDGNFLAAAVRQKFSLNERIEKVLQGKCILYVTRAALDELGQLPGPIFEQARRLGLDECAIIENESLPNDACVRDTAEILVDQASNMAATISASEAIRRLLTTTIISDKKSDGGSSSQNNPRKFFLATQDTELAEQIRSRAPNVPILRISQSVLLLEAPSSSSKRSAANEERSKQAAGTMMTSQELEMVQEMKKQNKVKNVIKTTPHSTRTKQRAKGPNPLSCKKKKNDAVNSSDTTQVNRKRKRAKPKSDLEPSPTNIAE
mmetsp:Transcript_1883/g.2921  ORF Transcript_1883/g.2921 Transcript_1883/m.2921 type:complete len:291 (+) Transcript_1883:94-966(+)